MRRLRDRQRRVINSSPGDLAPVFETILEKAHSLCAVAHGALLLYDGETFRAVASRGLSEAFAVRLRPGSRRASQHAAPPVARGRALRPVLDWAEIDDPIARATLDAGIRTTLFIPLRREGKLLGYIGASRPDLRAFTEKEIAILESFAAQAVITIENTRLLHELRERSSQLELRSQEVAKLNQQLEQRVADQVGEIERIGRLRRFLPPQIADLVIASGTETQLESHRREITAVFCDLRSFTGFSESADPEDVMALLRDYHATIGEIITRYSGTLERYAGDGVMVVFNDPLPVENSALQAVLMALDMREAIGSLIERWRKLGHDRGFGIGIAHGFATLGT